MLRVLTFLLGPIFAKEALEVARGRRYYGSPLLYGLLLLAVVVLVAKEMQQNEKRTQLVYRY